MFGIVLRIVFIFSFVLSAHALAADKTAGGKNEPMKQAREASAKVAYQPPQDMLNAVQKPMERAELIFSAAPRENAERSQEIFGPIAEYLSKTIGKKVVYQYPGTWGVYQGTMQKGGYDLLYDGPHFNGWRLTKLQHNVLVKIPVELTFVMLVKKDSAKINDIKQLAGHTICAHAPPNFGTLTFLSQFDNPSRQPVIVNTDGWNNIYKGLIAGKCTAALVPTKVWEKNDKNGVETKVIFKSKPLPNQAFSAGPRIPKEDQAKIAQALTSREAEGPTEKLRQEYSVANLVPALNKEYAGLGDMLKNEWGYN